MKPYKEFEPHWFEEPAPEKSYRSIFKWGDPSFRKIPRENLYKLIKEELQMTDEDFKQYDGDLGVDEVKFDIPVGLAKEHIAYLESVVGKEFVKYDDYSRLSVAYGKTMYDLLRLRKKIVENIPDVVVYPDKKRRLKKLSLMHQSIRYRFMFMAGEVVLLGE